ncbi:flagellar basal body P-ring formation chaperone FlgA [Halocynthiibacter sp. C4]|uniref:flagellar basal body P-ring formation chaperone FlgA n=1 Tax=Halocynthiibacter sp. C4 TaxID=2992758 RepID=UPI00237B013B|nr:flagellar basal body P-ring formation chaperone FlgA [Halocynthiibacter sp. C4]MDE0591353.1 flagellar basal body P-ring formation chaperone FlgA [Halocynthiibacter sp. C4]
MRLLMFIAATLFSADVATSDILVAARTLRSGDIIGASDYAIAEGSVASAIDAATNIAGLEAKTAIYAGQPIQAGSIGAPTVVARNQPVLLIYSQGGIFIATEARALGRGGAGDAIKVMNLASRSTVLGVVQTDGSVKVK